MNRRKIKILIRRWSYHHQKQSITIVLSSLIIMIIITLLKKKEDKPIDINILSPTSVLYSLESLNRLKESQKKVIDQASTISHQLDSLLNIKNKSYSDTIHIIQKHKQLEYITQFYEKNKF